MAITPNPKFTELEFYDLELHDQVEHLDRQIQQLEQDLDDPPDNSLPPDIDIDTLPETIRSLELECDQLKEQLSVAFHQNVIKSTAARSLNESHLVIKNLPELFVIGIQTSSRCFTKKLRNEMTSLVSIYLRLKNCDRTRHGSERQNPTSSVSKAGGVGLESQI
jgi:regulator of replication initiation timing